MPLPGCELNMTIISQIANFNEFGKPTRTENLGAVRYYINEYWTSRQRQANRIHEISYRACFKPQLPAFFINRMTEPENVVYDPFMGRGTTPVESTLLGRIPYGNDANPISIALTEPRVNPPEPSAVVKRLSEIPWRDFKDFSNEDLLVFYHPDTLAQIEGLRDWLRRRERNGKLDAVDKWLRMTAINRLTGHSRGFFSVYTMPPNQAVSLQSQHRINKRRNQTPEPRDVPALIWRKSKSLLSQEVSRARRYLFTNEMSHQTKQIPDSCIDLVVTSPPFLDVVDYDTDNWLRNWFIGIDAATVNITMTKSISDWRDFIHATLNELSRVLRSDGCVAFEVGEVRSAKVRLELEVVAAAAKTPFETLGVMVNQQNFTKTSNCWGVENNSLGTNSNRIVILRNAK